MPNQRRKFLQKLGTVGVASAVLPSVLTSSNANAATHYLKGTEIKSIKSANDKIRIGLIGTGGMGIGDAQTALGIPGVEIVAAADLYTGRLERAKELWGNQIFTTRDYREILNRSDVDVIINATVDHWHTQISIDAMKAGKHVYCEKPMVKFVEEGHQVIQAQKQYKKVFQVGSQYVSSIIHKKANELIKEGAIGEINFAEAQIDRHDALGAWQYTIPLDASTQTVDWDTYLGKVSKRPFDAKQFFRWRNYQDFGTGMAGDLYVHMLSMLHFVTGSKGPTRVMSTGGLRYWKDGRDVPDIHVGLFDYPDSAAHKAFNLTLRTNLVSGGGDNYLFRIVGSEGDISIGWDNLVLRKTPFPKAPKMSLNSFPVAMQEKLKEAHAKQYVERFAMEEPKEMTYRTPKDYKGDRFEHFYNFFDSVRNGTPVVEDATFGLRACGPTVAGNISYFEKRIVEWDPERMILKK